MTQSIDIYVITFFFTCDTFRASRFSFRISFYVTPALRNRFFYNPARIIIAGYSNSGKSVICSKIIEKYYTNFNTILYCGVGAHKLEIIEEINKKTHCF